MKKAFIISSDFQDIALFKPKEWRGKTVELYAEEVQYYSMIHDNTMIPVHGNLSPRHHKIIFSPKQITIKHV